MFGRDSKATARIPETGPGEPAGRDVMWRQVPSEAPYTAVVDTRNAERGRGFLSGDGQMHGAARRNG